MDSLTKMALIKSAKYDYTEVALNKNNLFIGANGAGKTTLLRAVLYFYTANAKGLGISSAKKISFLDYYFPYENSYIAYLYKKEQKYVLVALYKNTKIGFRFCLLDTEPDLKALFTEKNYPKTQAKLWEKMREIGSLSKSLSASEYRDVLYSKHNKLRYLSLFEAKEYDGFVKTLANIFINNRVDSEAIKKVIVSSLRVEKEIDIERIQRQLGEFNRTYEDILAYDKSVDQIQKLVTLLREFDTLVELLGDNLASLAYSKEHTKEQLKHLYEQNSMLLQKIQSLQESMNKSKELFIKRNRRLDEAIGKYKALIKKTKEKKLYYEELKIEEKIEAYTTLESLKEKLQLLLQQKEFITKAAQELRLAHENSLKAIENHYTAVYNTIEKEKNLLEVEQSRTISEYKDQQRDALEEIELAYVTKLNTLKEEIHNTLFGIEKMRNALQNEKNRSFVFKKDKAITATSNELQTIEKESKEQQHQLALLDAKLEKEEAKAQKDEAYLLKQQQQKQETFDEKIEQIKKLLTPKKESLLYALSEGGYDIDKYLYCIKDELLHTQLRPTLQKSDTMQLFEVVMDPLIIEKNTLREDLYDLQEQKQEKILHFSMEIQKLKNTFEKIQKSIYRSKRELVSEIKELQKSMAQLQAQSRHLAMQKERAHQEFEKEQKSQIKRLQNEVLLQEQQLALLNATLKKQTEEKKRQLGTKKAHFTKRIHEVQKEFAKRLNKLKNKALFAKRDQSEELAKQEKLYKERLAEKNIDIKALQTLEDKEQNLHQEIDAITAYYPLIIAYENDKAEYLDRLKEYEQSLKTIQHEQKELQESYNLATSKERSQLKQLQEEYTKNERNIEHHKKVLQRVAEFEESASMQECRALHLSYEANENFEDLDLLLDGIGNLLAQHRESEKQMSSAINKLHPLFNTSLNIKYFEDPLQSAHSIEEFYVNNKIKEVKNLQESNLNQIVKNAIEEYDNLMFYSQKIESLIKQISRLFTEIEIGVIDELSLRYLRTNNRVIEKLSQVKALNNQNPNGYGISLFNDKANSQEMIRLLKNLRDTIELENIGTITLEDSFVLEFRVIENGNDSRYQPSLDNIGSNGTDVLVKTMIYIAMLYIFKTKTTKKELEIHVILDEIGILSQRYLKELIEFANRYNIYFINGAPDEKLIGTYKRVFLVSNRNSRSIVQEIIAK